MHICILACTPILKPLGSRGFSSRALHTPGKCSTVKVCPWPSHRYSHKKPSSSFNTQVNSYQFMLVWWLMPVIPAPGAGRQENCYKLEASWKTE